MSPKFNNPHAPNFTTHNRLPHWWQQGATYFVTFRLADSVPRDTLRSHVAARRAFEANQGPRPWASPVERDYYRRFFGKVEHWLDQGSGECLLGEPGNAAILHEALHFHDEQRYRLHAWVVMPNHVHVLFETLGEWTLAQILKSWKGFTARQINERLGRTGPLWQRSYFDRMIRDWPHFGRCVRYILRNPEKAGLGKAGCPLGTSRVADRFRESGKIAKGR
ncbi:transposase [Haloferula sp. A504]|uniref:transposase n=1 Tax=Haloferula sp. A504 TaxID=3373601 RepID=UPI0031C9456E|nr:transposase [Verrucomicrobiaceae bacterium E54]